MTDNILQFPKPDTDLEILACPECDGCTFITFTDGLGCLTCKSLFDVAEFYTLEMEWTPDDAS